MELLRVAATNADGVTALAAAYAELDHAERARLVDAIESASLEHDVVFHLLATVLAVETDVAVAEHIVARMKRHRPHAAGPETDPSLRAFVAGDESSGALVLLRPLHGPFVESLALAWSGATTEEPGVATLTSSFAPVLHESETAALVRSWSGRTSLDRALVETVPRDAIELLATVVWTDHRRTGRWPAGLERFADLL